MSLLLSYVTLEELAQELGLSSAAQVLQRMLKARIFPVLPLRRDWHVFVTPHFPDTRYQVIKSTVVHRPDVQGIELDEAICIELLACPVSKTPLTSADAAWVLPHKPGQESVAASSSHLHRQTLPVLLQHDKDARDWSMPDQCFIALPRFTVFDVSNHPVSEVKKWRFFEDIQCSPGALIKLSELRVSPEDEAKLRQSLTQPKPTPKHLPTSGQHISVQLGQLLEVFNEHRDDIRQALTKNTPSAQREQLSRDLHNALQTKDPARWQGETLRGYAVGLIFPTPSDRRRSKKPALYTGDGIPKKLATLLENLANQLQEVMTFETGQWKDWLIVQLGMSEKEASNVTTIVRLTLPPRGGNRLPVQSSPKVQ